MAKVQYWNAYDQGMRCWDTATGGTYMTVSGAGGDVLAMDETQEKGLARLAWFEAKNPGREYRVWFGPCAFSARDVWIAVDERPTDRVQRTAQWRVSQLSGRNEDGTWKANAKMSSWELDGNRRVYDIYKGTYKLSSQYF
jgi:hypothetical protein